MLLMLRESDDQDPYNLTFGGSDDLGPNNWCYNHDLWDLELDEPRALYACVLKRSDSIRLTKTRRMFFRLENL